LLDIAWPITAAALFLTRQLSFVWIRDVNVFALFNQRRNFPHITCINLTPHLMVSAHTASLMKPEQNKKAVLH